MQVQLRSHIGYKFFSYYVEASPSLPPLIRKEGGIHFIGFNVVAMYRFYCSRFTINMLLSSYNGTCHELNNEKSKFDHLFFPIADTLFSVIIILMNKKRLRKECSLCPPP